MHLRRDDRGVTLIEVLVAIVILGIIIVPLGNALISFSRNTDDTTRRLSESHDVQIMAAYFAQDVQSVGVREAAAPYKLKQSIEPGASGTSGPYPCGTASTPPALVRFAWDDPTNASATRVVRVSYVVQTVGTENQLHRITCLNPPATPTSDIVLAHNVSTATPPFLTCFNPSSCTSALVPQSVTLTVTIKNPSSSGSPITLILTGQRRQT
jgi:prepilin-type N-terminal cleavage/methylation domain-containing protein